jgi:carbamoyltransferase
MINERFCRLFGGPARSPAAATTQRDCDLARSIQVVAEEVILRMAHTAHAVTGEKRLCLAGGVALNCVANGRLLREGPFEEIWVQPAAGDAGGALGAALSYYHEGRGTARSADGTVDLMQGTRLGPEYPDEAVAAALGAYGLSAPVLDEPQMLERVASRVAEGAVVGFFQGRAEFGPRALGSRSILADARSPAMQRVLNLKIKGRESFRPFAPIVLAERAADYFDLAQPSPYMLFTAPVKEARRRAPPDGTGDLLAQVNAIRSDIPAVTHVDFSARVQTVGREQMPQLHALLTAFERRTGCAVMINTSFNVRGEPPVCAPRDAIECFLRTEMDVLAIGNRVIEKRDVPVGCIQGLPPRAFAPD